MTPMLNIKSDIPDGMTLAEYRAHSAPGQASLADPALRRVRDPALSEPV